MLLFAASLTVATPLSGLSDAPLVLLDQSVMPVDPATLQFALAN